MPRWLYSLAMNAADGQLEEHAGRWRLRFERRLAHPPERVWRGVTQPRGARRRGLARVPRRAGRAPRRRGRARVAAGAVGAPPPGVPRVVRAGALDDRPARLTAPPARYSAGAPCPPPPGVSIRRRVPLRSLPDALGATSSPSTRLRPHAPSPPPSAPGGGWRRRSVSSEYVMSSSASSSRTTPSPPRCSPSPPEPRRSAYSVTRSGNSSSSASTGVFSVLLIATCTPLGPSASGHAPWPPPSVS